MKKKDETEDEKRKEKKELSKRNRERMKELYAGKKADPGTTDWSWYTKKRREVKRWEETRPDWEQQAKGTSEKQ
jgi:hypothetical protein